MKKTIFNLAKLPFLLIITLIVILGTATFIEKKQGTEFIATHVYESWWFAGIWGLVACSSLLGIIKGKMIKNIPLLLVHLSFIMILAGALCTRLSATHGYIILDKHVTNSTMHTNETLQSLPFEVTLDTFYIAFYPGTDAPADYISQIHITDPNAGKVTPGQTSMNNIFSYSDYRFYQSSYQNEGNTSILSINKDSWGIPVTYTGYALFVLSMLWYLFSPKNAYRKLFSHPLLKITTVFLLLFLPISASGNVLSKDSLTVNKQQAEEFGKLWMLNDGRITPISVFAHDFTLKLTGKSTISGLNANQFLMGFLFFPEKWQRVMLFEIKNNILREELHAENSKAALMDFFDEKGHYKLLKYQKELTPTQTRSPLLKEIKQLDEKIQLINMLYNGSLLKFYPLKAVGEKNIRWFSPSEKLPETTDIQNVRFIQQSLLNYYQALAGNNEQETVEMLNKISNFQYTNAKESLPSDFHRSAELFYLKTNPTAWLFKINLTVGLISLLTIFGLKGRKRNILNTASYILLIICFVVQTASIGLRTYISGYLPFSNGFETMMIIAWCAMLPALILHRKIAIIIPLGFLISGFSLLVAHLSIINPKITPLVPVLSSPLLSIHVSVIMLAYTLLAFVAFNGIISLIQLLITPKEKHESICCQLEQNKIYSLICLYPALLFLVSGIFIGAVWANVSWGRYWGWDPKEVWALITFLIYSLVLHGKNLRILTDPFFFHVFSIVAFFSVLMTYFGVNYFLGGMHSYAGEMQSGTIWILLIASIIVIAIFLIIGYLKYKSINFQVYMKNISKA